MDFRSLQHIRLDRRGCMQGVPPPCPCRSQGFLTLSADFGESSRAEHFSSRLRSWDYPFEAFSTQAVRQPFSQREPTCRFASEYRCRTRQQPVSTSRGSWASTRPSVPYRTTAHLSGEPIGGSLGVCAFQGGPAATFRRDQPAVLSRASA